MSFLTPEDVERHVKTYQRVFAVLLVMTVFTVIAAELHLSSLWAIGVALAIATAKGSLVASYFMHLKSEKRIILAALALAVFFFLVLLVVPLATSPHTEILPQYEP